MISPTPREDEDNYILYEEVERAINQFKKGKSPCNDGRRGEMIRENLKEKIWKKKYITYVKKYEKREDIRGMEKIPNCNNTKERWPDRKQ